MNGKITVKGEHISYKLKDDFIIGLTYSGSVSTVLELMNSNATYDSGFNFNSDITDSYSFTFNKTNFLNAILGTDATSILSVAGDYDIVRDNFNFNIKVNGGLDNNVLISYKKNMTAFTCEEDYSSIVTKIYPYATVDSTEISLAEKYIESPYINNYPNAIVLAVDFTSYFDTSTETISEDTLRTKSSTYFADNECDIPTLTYTIEFVALSKTEEYKNFAFNESIGLNDSVIIRHETYGLDTKVKVTKTIYNTIAEKYTKIELGQPKDSITSVISTAIKSATKDKVTKGFLDESIIELSNKITGNDGGYVRLNPPENPSEILVMDNEDLNLASTVWRWNKEGWGVSTSGYNGTFVGLAKDGKLVVNEVTANKITANLVKTGTLMSNNNLSWINMDDGTFNFNNLLKWDGTNFAIDYASVKDAINKVSNYFQVTNEGATFGNVASGDYTSVTTNGLQHHIGSSNYDYKYVTYCGMGSTSGTGTKQITINFPADIVAMLNGKVPYGIASVAYYGVGSDHVCQNAGVTVYSVTSTSITLQTYFNTGDITSYVSSGNDIHYITSGLGNGLIGFSYMIVG